MSRYVPALHYVISAALLIALLPMPYGYYQLLRITAFLAFIALAVDAHSKQRPSYYWLWLFGLALLYNPIFRIHFERETWVFLNVMTVMALAADLLYRRRTEGRLS